jgi:hypothetical protein
MLRSLVDVCEDPKRLKRECETPTEVATVWTEVLIPPELSTEPMGLRFSFPIELRIDLTSGMRPVIDLSILNTYLVVPHLKMETNRFIRASILPGVWSTSLDLADAYFHFFQEIRKPSSRRRSITVWVWDKRMSGLSSLIRESSR